MKVDAIKLSFLTYLRHLEFYDYLALTWFILTFIIFIIFAIVIAKRSSALSLLLIIFALMFFVFTPFALKFKLNELLRTTHIEVLSTKKLTYSESLIVEAHIVNASQKELKHCLVETKLIKKNPSEGFFSLINRLKPIENQSMLVQEPLKKGETLDYKTIFDDFSYQGDVVAYITAECY